MLHIETIKIEIIYNYIKLINMVSLCKINKYDFFMFFT